MTDTYKRRYFLHQVWSLAPLLGVALIGACGDSSRSKKENNPPSGTPPAAASPCALDALSQQERQQRDALGYTDETPIAEQTCDNCKLYIPESETKPCGTCTLFKGPVASAGYCTYWADSTV